MRIGVAVAAFAGLCLAIAPAIAADPVKPLGIPDAAEITIPSMAFTPTPRDIANYDTYYYFYKPGATYWAAYRDIIVCHTYGDQARLMAPPPKFVPLGSHTSHPHDDAPPLGTEQYGVIGALIGGAMLQAAEADATDATIRRCMLYKGYARYGTTRFIARQLDADTLMDSYARRALVAAGPAPQIPALEP